MSDGAYSVSGHMPPPAPPLLAVENLGVERNGRRILDNIGFSLAPGEIVSVIGPNGGGKTTLLRCILGLVPADTGRVRLAPGTSIGYVPQKLSIDATMPLTPRRFLTLGMGNPHKANLHADIPAVAERTGITRFLDRQLAGLSGGETQKVLLARAILKQPSLLVMDEPTQGMDVSAQSGVFRLVEAIRRESGAAVLMVSHDLHLVMRGTNRVLCLNGHMCCTGHPAEIGRDPGFRALFGHFDDAAVVPYRHHHDHRHDDMPHDHTHDDMPRGHTHDDRLAEAPAAPPSRH